jgi:hypothetical protein
MFYDQLEYLRVIWYILWLMGHFVVIWYILAVCARKNLATRVLVGEIALSELTYIHFEKSYLK